MIALKRRGLLAGLAGGLGLLAAPSIVRAKSLMAISPQHTYPAGGILTPQMIAREAVRILRRNLAAQGNEVHVRGPLWRVQNLLCVDVPGSALQMSVQTYCERYLEPAMADLAAHTRGKPVIGEACDVPDGVSQCAAEEYGGVGLRYVRAYDAENKRTVSRFDIRTA